MSLSARTDLAHGGRWTSLRAGEREWLWRREEPARDAARLGAVFVDAGGLEECVPTVRGAPDHGDAWSRPWRRADDWDEVACPDFLLRRRIRCGPCVRADYRLTAEPGYRFLWAAHALLDVSPAARLVAPAGTPTRLFPEAARVLGRWPLGAPHVTGDWPAPLGVPLDRLGPDDGTALGAVLVGRAAVRVVDGPDALTLAVRAEPGVPVGVALWRNLGGFPPGRAYRSIGVEPMLGTVFDLAAAGPADAATVPATGELRWSLELTATTEDEGVR